jgi:putative hemolysin
MDALIIVCLILLNGLFAMSEMAIVSSRKARLRQLADEGRAGARGALELANEPGHFLSTIQIGITVIGILSGAIGEEVFAVPLGAELRRTAWLAPYADAVALAIVVSLIAFCSIIVGELVPKRLALVSPERIASLVSRPLGFLAKAGHPLVRLLSGVTDAVLRLFRIRTSQDAPVTKEEIKVLMEQGAQAGIFEKHEQMIVSRALRLDRFKVTGVMTPRTNLVCVDAQEPFESAIARMVSSGHARLPLLHGGPRQIAGMVTSKTVLRSLAEGKHGGLLAHAEEALFVPEELTVIQLLEQFKVHRRDAALIVNQFGEVLGLVTMSDVLHSLIGDIGVLEDEAKRDAVLCEDGSWLVDGTMTTERFKDVAGISGPLPEEDTGIFHTAGGFAMAQLGRVPQVGDRFTWENYRFEIVHMDGNRVDKMRVSTYLQRTGIP